MKSAEIVNRIIGRNAAVPTHFNRCPYRRGTGMSSRAGGVGLVGLVGAGGGGAGAGGQIGVRVVKSVSGVVICISHVGVSVGCIIGVAFAG